MCGINGFTFSDPAALRRMHQLTRHRGPDDEGFFEDQEISLAHNRLSIIDLSSAGKQPMQTTDGRFVIVFNGEIYNYRQLRAELESLGIRFRSQSDTEVLLYGFEKWGESLLPKLRGIFAFAIWDTKEKRLTLARDQMGVKPLYYTFDGQRLIFSSELKAIFVHPISRELHPPSLNVYFHLLYVPGSQTIFSQIKKLPGGTVATFSRGTLSIRQWWRVREGSPIENPNEIKALLREKVKEAVASQLISDRPLGVFLSGGIDSTLVLGVMRSLVSTPIQTFTIGYETDIQSERYNADAELAKKTASFFGCEHHAFTMSATEAMSSLERVIWHMDEPVSNHVQTSTYLLAKYAKPLITVALGGDGGDELFGGYARYWYSRAMDRLQRMPRPLRRAFGASFAHLFKKQDFWEDLQTPFSFKRFLLFVSQKESVIQSFLKQSAHQDSGSFSMFDDYFTPVWHDRTNQLMATDLQTWIPDESLIRTDRLTMAHGLEERVPLLDPELVRLAFRIPSRFKLGTRRQGKRILIDAFRDVLPPYVLNQEKRGWFSPTAKWMRGPMLPFVREILSPSFEPATQVYFDFKAIQNLLDAHVEGRVYALNTLWSLVTFQLWYRTFMTA
ncbi:MAG TPA: asparagine synthase (glutamine-hydrolyzing) [Patescibacteria group bacterium]|nr:asparagine synthase (glutamine-hydrolyzing) [Patescibacteria group bacterium]